ncbi:DEBR0S3_13608g1_1 [Brettanomyces bruxellensis]|uniref:DEBR0S3_13608g1_1 n=1 Tax=Dekkera bruxellensis TaxID=5007 RepID=A0A7D9H0C2_DEKBR|nr:DEBR0S3_13608g1_1 [Brettanomyces bruxellensis]
MTVFPDNLAADPPPFDPRAQTQTVFKVQLGICSGLGLVISFLFCVLRRRFPVIYAIRPYRNKNIRMLPGTLFGWIPVLYDISPEEVLQVAGLDAYVFLRFFRMCVKILLVLSVLGIAFMCPVRYWLTGHFDRDLPGSATGAPGGPTGDHSEPPGYLLLCTIFTYVFTLVVYYFMFSETRHIIRTRQRFLGSQKSLTDRTIMITNVPAPMRDETALKMHIEQLGVGRVDSVFLARDYTVLRELFVRREAVRSRLEALYSRYYGLEVHVLRPAAGGAHGAPAVALRGLPGGVTGPPGDATGSRRPLLRLGPLGLVGRKVDAIRYFSWLLVHTDGQIRRLKHRATFRPIPCAFVSMKSVTDAQMAAQALFSPNPSQLETCLAPAPFDIAWNNLLLSSRQVFMRRNVIEMLCMAFSALLIVPIRYITSLLNVQYIKKLWPEFGRYLLAHDTLRTLVTGVLPTYLFTIINTILPYCIYSLCQLQGMPSKGEMELSVVKKNFMYIFFNMFLVFTLFGTFTSYRALLSDTTKIAPLLAKSIESLSLFYVDLIVLHGFTILPLQLLQFGDLLLDFWHCVICRLSQTPRTLRDLFYKPTIFQVGLVLPQHILILIIILIYSVLSTRIMVCGLVYFFVGYWVYKYQLVYSMVHPYHSTGKVWPIVFQRVCLGLFFLHLQMFGTLALEKSYVPAGLIIPLFPTTLIAMMYFKRNYLPLLNYIALDAIKTDGLSVDPGSEDDFESFIRSAKPKKRGNSVVLTDGYYDSAGILHVDNPDQPASQSASQAASPTSDHGCALDDTDVANLSQSTLQNQHMIRRKPSTIEEQREALQNYVYPYLVDPLDGPLVGFLGDYIDTIRYRKNVVYRHAAYGSVQDQEVYHDLERDFEEHSDLEVEIVRTENSQNEYD